ncbi:cell division topological specificity factor MinE [Clostridium sp. Ade.TY]|uniref:cell division topological specificity factor MinE n=1 Tax=Clostridium sp. Ade.TY TaxID=1391647 RepID=UPI000426A944|nr:cell division topological specificity factor MinE [Clostridium sp. Ade.TY]
MGFFSSLTNSKPKPKDIAKDRLKLILIHDRGNIPTETLEKIRLEILEVLSKYIEIAAEDVEISVSKSDIEEGEASSALIANIPIKNIRGQ